MPTSTRNPAIFPDFVAQHTVLYDETDPRDLGELFPGVPLSPALAKAARKRRIEHAAGRHCAREALRLCRPSVADVPIGSGPSREPLWPTGIVGAITHTHGYASAAVAPAHAARGLGLDAEVWMAEDQAANVVDSIAEAAEVDAIARATSFSFARALTLIFSAKETVFKCLHPEVKRYFDFRDARVIAADAGGAFVVELLADLTPSLGAGSIHIGRFEHDAAMVYTAMVRPPA